ncbi:unnamed protein product [Schistosoma guineensis]|nr:unnamed protein product [Schistosoma guineensis]
MFCPLRFLHKRTIHIMLSSQSLWFAFELRQAVFLKWFVTKISFLPSLKNIATVSKPAHIYKHLKRKADFRK